MLMSACLGFIYALCFGFKLAENPAYYLDDWRADGLAFGIVIALTSLLLQRSLLTPLRPPAFQGNRPMRGRGRVARFFQAVHGPEALLIAGVLGLSMPLTPLLSSVLLNTPYYGLSLALSTLFDNGHGLGTTLLALLSSLLTPFLWALLSYVLMSKALDAQMGDIHLAERLR